MARGMSLRIEQLIDTLDWSGTDALNYNALDRRAESSLNMMYNGLRGAAQTDWAGIIGNNGLLSEHQSLIRCSLQAWHRH